MIKPLSTSQQHGFVLVIVLAMLVVLTLLATAVGTSAERALQAAQADADQFQAELDLLGSRDTFLFLTATQRRTVAGVTVREQDAVPLAAAQLDPDSDALTYLPVGDEIHLDGTVYKGLGDTLFAVQDDRGLLSINWASPLLLAKFYESRGITSSLWPGLEAKRLDYQDRDDLHRLDGAEKDHYQQAQRPPPSNRPLVTPLEVRRILGWDSLLKDMTDEDILSTLSLSRASDINLNTAPPSILALLPGVSSANAKRLVEMRRAAPILSTYQIQQIFGLPAVTDELLNLFAIPSGNLILWNEHSGARRLIHWTLTPLENDGPPWRIDYEVTLPRGNESNQAVARSPSTPFFSTQNTLGEHN